jgi:hypothetical protein
MCLLKYIRDFYIRIQHFLDHIFLKISVEDKHIIKFDSRQQQDIFLQNVKTPAGMYPASYLTGTGVSFRGIKESSLGMKFDHFPPSGVKLNYEWNYTSAPLMCFHGLDTYFTISEC